jgi:hypothetical protein
MSQQPEAIDRDKLRAAVRRLAHEYVFFMLDDAIALLSPAKLHKIARKYLDLNSLRPDSQMKRKASLLTAVKAFDKTSRAGEYYESFMVNSKGTPADVRDAFDILFELLDCIDECNDNRDTMLAIARKAATPEQRKALAGAPERQASRRRGGTKS